MMISKKRVDAFRKRLGCNLWDSCKERACLFEVVEFGVCVWSKAVCHALRDCINKGLVKEL